MLSIIEQERREAVKNYRASMAMPLADELELEYNRGWSDAKKTMPSATIRLIRSIVLLLAGACCGALLLWLLP